MRVSFTLRYFATLLTILTLSGCHRRPSFEVLPPQELFRHSVDLYNRGKYLDASDGLDFFTINYGGHALVDSAQYYLGMSHYQMKEYIIASDAFDQLTRRFPNSSLVPEAMFMVGECYRELSPSYPLDQTYTEKAIDAYQAFIDYYPEYRDWVQKAQKAISECREKLAHKVFANGVIYLKMKDFTAASIYFQEVLDRYYDTPWAAEAAFESGVSLAAAGKKGEALTAYRTYLEKYPAHKRHDEAIKAVEILLKPPEEEKTLPLND